MITSSNIARILICVCLVVHESCGQVPDGTPTSQDTSEGETSEQVTDTSSEVNSPLSTATDNVTAEITIDVGNDTIYTASPTDDGTDTTTVDNSSETTTNTTNEGNLTTEEDTTLTSCATDPCRNGGTCREGNTSSSVFSCLCPPGYTGIRCGVQDRCVEAENGILCEGGACVSSENDHVRKCGCFGNQYWDKEQKKCRDPELPCFPNPCLNGGSCVAEGESLQCHCATGFEGNRCSIINKCGKCERGNCLLDEKTSIKICRCDDGLYFNKNSQTCEEITSSCLPEPCENGGTCYSLSDEDYNCSCAVGFSGKTCDVVDKCSEDEDCGVQGKCTLSEDRTTRTCQCDKGFYLEKHSHTCNKIIAPCHPNPCFHDGICTPISEKNFKCTCSTGYTGANCAVRDMCKMDGGKEFCAGANCTDMHELDVFVCTCQEGQYFDYSKRECYDLDTCPLVKCGDAQKCIGGECVCQDNWAWDNNTSTCKPNICSSDPSPCPSPDMICEEGSGISDYTCSCRDGYAFNGTHCNEAFCAFPSLNKCGQHCEAIDEGYECSCSKDFQLEEDNMTCSYIGNSTCSNKTCDTCVKEGDEEICICSSGYVERDWRCVDVCGEGLIAEGVCPNQCEVIKEGGFRCKCEGKYALSKDKTTCMVRNVCQKDEIGWKNCTARNAHCKPDWQDDNGFKCVCWDGLTETTEGMCRDVCSIESNQKICSTKGAKCVSDVDGERICKCPPYFKNNNVSCNKPADVSFLVTLPLDQSAYQKRVSRKQRSLDTPLNFAKMLRDITLAAQNLFPGFTEANILTCSSKPGIVLCKIEMQFLNVQEADLRRLKSNKLCFDRGTLGSTQCLLPPSLVLVKDKISKNVEIRRTNPCDEDIKEMNCGSETTCMSSAPKFRGFNCSCRQGFMARGKTYPFGNTKSFIETCRDIDECKDTNACTANSNCTNTIGSYLCPCKSGFRSLADRDGDKCVEICKPNPCTHGDCSTRGDHEFDCTCVAGYRGTFCNLEDKNFKGARINTVIVGVVLGGILLITIVLFAACISRMKRKKYLNDPGHSAYNSAEMTERRRVVGAINNAFQKE